MHLHLPPPPSAPLALPLPLPPLQYLRMPGERIMKHAEELYQQGFLSYPRTETDQFDQNYDLRVGGRAGGWGPSAAGWLGRMA